MKTVKRIMTTTNTTTIMTIHVGAILMMITTIHVAVEGLVRIKNKRKKSLSLDRLLFFIFL